MRRTSTRIALVILLACIPARAEQRKNPSSDPYGIMLKPIAGKLVVLTFDDACRSHATFVGPLLKKHGFGATFYICEFGKTFADKTMYMTWEQIKALEDMGFEIGNHTVGHGWLGATSLDGCTRALMGIEDHCLANKVTRPTTFCWPVYSVNNAFFSILAEKGYVFARGGGTRAYRPTADCPFNTPSFSISDSDAKRDKDVFYKAVKRATPGQAVILTFHGVPDREHPTVGTDPARFEEYVKYLKDNRYTVIAMRDLAGYVDTAKAAQFLSFPKNLPWGGHSPAWGGVTRKGNLLYLCVNRLPADRKLTVPEMTTPIASACFLADSKKNPFTIKRKDTGIQTVVVPASSPEAFGANPTVIVATLQGGPIATILDFIFPGMPETTMSGNEIRVRVPMATDLTKLAPIYRTGSPLVTGQPACGSANDFTSPQTYTITAADRSTRRYVVTVTPTSRVVGVSDHSFERFDAFNGYKVAMRKDSRGTPWRFIQPKNNGEVGIRLEAPPPPNGSLHTAYIRGPGNGIAQSITFDKGNYTVSLDVAKRRGYEPTAAPVTVLLDGVPIFTLEASKITETWRRVTSPVFPVTAGTHTLAFVLGKGGMDLIDNVMLRCAK